MKKLIKLACLVLLCLTACGKKEQEITVQSIALSQPSAELKIGETLNLKATVSPSNATYDGITWTSTRTAVATVSSSGLVSALAEGNTTITAMAGGKTASCSVTVVKGVVAVSSISLNKDSIELVEGDSETLTATVSPNDATDKTVSWSSSNDAVATVKDGTITAVKMGEATITAKAGEKTASCDVVVAKKVIPVESIELNKTELALVEGDIETLTATISPEDATDKTISWTSSKESIATVKDGLVTAISEGEATITAKAGEKTASCKVVVAKKVIPVESIELNKTELELKKGESSTLSATVLPTNATNPTVSWLSSNSEIASVNQNGKVTALTGGEAIITAKAGDKTAECKVSISVPATSVFVDKTSVEMHPSETIQLVATILPDDMTDSIIWSSSDPYVASVNNSGKVTAHNKGAATIVVTAGDFSASCEVKVSANNDDVISFMDPNVKAKLVAAFDSDGDGELSYNEAEAVSSGDDLKAALGTIKTYKSFDEFQYFSGITSIPNSMFENWNLLSSVTLPQGLAIIPDSCFKGCVKIQSIIVPETVSTIGLRAFMDCSSLCTINIPNAVTRIGEEAFSNCSKLSSFICIPEGVTVIETGTFSGCISLTKISIPKSVQRIQKRAFADCESLSSAIVIPEQVTEIEDWVFSGCSSIPSITIPYGVTRIGEYALQGCSSLSNLVIPESVSTIGQGAFRFLTITSIIIPESVSSLGGHAFVECHNLTSVTIPESITRLEAYTFWGCTSLTEVKIPESVSIIGAQAFSKCTSLTSITIPNSVTSIGSGVFLGCSNLRSVSISECLTLIAAETFMNCSSLSSVTIPESVQYIGNSAFYNCTGLTGVVVKAKTPPAISVSSGERQAVFDNTNNCPIYVPSESVEAYKGAEYWSAYTSRIQAIQ